MGRGLLARIRRHASMASGNFAAMFEGVEIPPLPAAAARLIEEINQPDPELDRLVKVISASPETSAKVIQTINSSLFALRSPVLTVRHAVSLLGLRHIRPIALSYAMVDAIPRPKDNLFDHGLFWIDCLLRAILARSFAHRHCQGDEEEAFTAMLIADVALPVLLDAWGEYYTPVIEQWRSGTERLSAIERRIFSWDHAQAGSWILQSWNFPEELVCFVGLHNVEPEQLAELELTESIALPIVVAAQLPSGLRPDPNKTHALVHSAMEVFSMTAAEMKNLIAEVQIGFDEIRELFDLGAGNAPQVFEHLTQAAAQEDAEE